MSGQFHVPAALFPAKEPQIIIGQEAGWATEPVWKMWRGEKSHPYRESNSDPSVVRSVVSRCTDCAIPALHIIIIIIILLVITGMLMRNFVTYVISNTRMVTSRRLTKVERVDKMGRQGMHIEFLWGNFFLKRPL
jgi:hypothetical protein